MVGALADWFAVTALFRHPLGIRIPHTAIIPTRKDALGDSLGEFVGTNFLAEQVVRERLRRVGRRRPARRVARRSRPTPSGSPPSWRPSCAARSPCCGTRTCRRCMEQAVVAPGRRRAVGAAAGQAARGRVRRRRAPQARRPDVRPRATSGSRTTTRPCCAWCPTGRRPGRRSSSTRWSRTRSTARCCRSPGWSRPTRTTRCGSRSTSSSPSSPQDLQTDPRPRCSAPRRSSSRCSTTARCRT